MCRHVLQLRVKPSATNCRHAESSPRSIQVEHLKTPSLESIASSSSSSPYSLANNEGGPSPVLPHPADTSAALRSRLRNMLAGRRKRLTLSRQSSDPEHLTAYVGNQDPAVLNLHSTTLADGTPSRGNELSTQSASDDSPPALLNSIVQFRSPNASTNVSTCLFSPKEATPPGADARPTHTAAVCSAALATQSQHAAPSLRNMLQELKERANRCQRGAQKWADRSTTIKCTPGLPSNVSQHRSRLHTERPSPPGPRAARDQPTQDQPTQGLLGQQSPSAQFRQCLTQLQRCASPVRPRGCPEGVEESCPEVVEETSLMRSYGIPENETSPRSLASSVSSALSPILSNASNHTGGAMHSTPVLTAPRNQLSLSDVTFTCSPAEVDSRMAPALSATITVRRRSRRSGRSVRSVRRSSAGANENVPTGPDKQVVTPIHRALLQEIENRTATS